MKFLPGPAWLLLNKPCKPFFLSAVQVIAQFPIPGIVNPGSQFIFLGNLATSSSSDKEGEEREARRSFRIGPIRRLVTFLGEGLSCFDKIDPHTYLLPTVQFELEP